MVVIAKVLKSGRVSAFFLMINTMILNFEAKISWYNIAINKLIHPCVII